MDKFLGALFSLILVFAAIGAVFTVSYNLSVPYIVDVPEISIVNGISFMVALRVFVFVAKGGWQVDS